MQLIKKINNNFCLARDSSGEEVIVRGRGVGFQKLPCELTDLSQIERTYYGVDARFTGLLNEISDSEFVIANEICDEAKRIVPVELSPNLVFVLADHLHFTVQRFRQGVVFQYPLELEMRRTYAPEMAVGERALDLISMRLGCDLPRDEAVGFAMNIINAELSRDATMEALLGEHVEQMTRILEQRLDIGIDRSSAEYSRFAAHIRYLLNCSSAGSAVLTSGDALYSTLKASDPQLAACASALMGYLKDNLGLENRDDEKLYLLLHISRLKRSAQAH